MNIKKKIIIYIFNSFLLYNIFSLLNLKSNYKFNKNIKNFTAPYNPNLPHIFNENLKIENIIIKGLVAIPIQAVLSKLPIKSGETLNPKKIALIVKNIYGLGYFTDVKLYYQKTKSGNVNLHIHLIEKKKITKFYFIGNEHISEETLEKQINFSKIHWIDTPTINVIIEKIKQYYSEKQYHNADIKYELEILENGSVNVKIIINEGIFSKIRTIAFKGNHSISKFELKNILVSRESWLLGF